MVLTSVNRITGCNFLVSVNRVIRRVADRSRNNTSRGSPEVELLKTSRLKTEVERIPHSTILRVCWLMWSEDLVRLIRTMPKWLGLYSIQCKAFLLAQQESKRFLPPRLSWATVRSSGVFLLTLYWNLLFIIYTNICTHIFIYLFILYLFIYPFIYLFIVSFIYLFILSFIYLFIYLFLPLFIL